MVDEMKTKAPSWMPKALEALTGVCKGAYEDLEDQDSMPPCFGAVAVDHTATDGFAWGLLNLPDGLDRKTCTAAFREALASLLRSQERQILGGFSITEGWELKEDMKTRTGREVLVINVESPDGWRATKMLTIERNSGDVELEENLESFDFHFGGEPDGAMQGMFAAVPAPKH